MRTFPSSLAMARCCCPLLAGDHASDQIFGTVVCHCCVRVGCQTLIFPLASPVAYNLLSVVQATPRMLNFLPDTTVGFVSGLCEHPTSGGAIISIFDKQVG